MELKELVGKHMLSGCDQSSGTKDANALLFVLDGVTYRVTEDEDDGYRSSMRDIEVVDVPVANVFPPVEVLGVADDDILTLTDTITGKVVIEVGTDTSDSYYPSYVANFTPEHMASNVQK